MVTEYGGVYHIHKLSVWPRFIIISTESGFYWARNSELKRFFSNSNASRNFWTTKILPNLPKSNYTTQFLQIIVHAYIKVSIMASAHRNEQRDLTILEWVNFIIIPPQFTESRHAINYADVKILVVRYCSISPSISRRVSLSYQFSFDTILLSFPLIVRQPPVEFALWAHVKWNRSQIINSCNDEKLRMKVHRIISWS